MEDVQIKPYITEKSLQLASKGWYTFATRLQARKPLVAATISRLYAVTVTRVRSILVSGKTRRVGRKMTVMSKPNWKKIFVHLAQGEKIPVFEVTQEGEKKK
ncbi:50S ribosomal protein L23 [Candidatus Gottesmanbacteria bacterium]|nr:50S ribosomal protein L23 [Candidatus Gottesmanbacteria bacterium]